MAGKNSQKVVVSDSAEQFLTRTEAAKFTRFSEGTLAKWACLGKGPAYHKCGTGKTCRVRYPLSSLIEFLKGECGSR